MRKPKPQFKITIEDIKNKRKTVFTANNASIDIKNHIGIGHNNYHGGPTGHDFLGSDLIINAYNVGQVLNIKKSKKKRKK